MSCQKNAKKTQENILAHDTQTADWSLPILHYQISCCLVYIIVFLMLTHLPFPLEKNAIFM